MKPLGRKAYGSIPHLPASRLGPGDHYISPGQQVILTEKARDSRDRIIVSEKLDGACVAIARKDGELLALGRAGYLAQSCPHVHVQHFGIWLDQNKARFAHLAEGERLCGEWLSVAHGTLYAPMDIPFVPFDLMVAGDRLPIDQMKAVAAKAGLAPAYTLHDGGPLSVQQALSLIERGGFHGALDDVEGCVWRCERDGKFEFIAKFVRHEKQDGKYLEEFSGNQPIWFWKPAEIAA